MAKALTFFVFLLDLAINANCSNKDSATWYFSITPQYLYNNCFRFDFERRLSKADWIGFSQEIYFGQVNDDNTANGPNSTVVRYNSPHQDIIKGEGFTLKEKIFFEVEDNYYGFYFGLGFTYSNLDITFQDNAWVPFQMDGLTYFGYGLKNGDIHLSRYDGFMGLGFATGFAKSFHADIFVGGGYRVINSTDNMPGYRNYTRNFFDFQFAGFHPVITVGLGYSF